MCRDIHRDHPTYIIHEHTSSELWFCNSLKLTVAMSKRNHRPTQMVVPGMDKAMFGIKHLHWSLKTKLHNKMLTMFQ